MLTKSILGVVEHNKYLFSTFCRESTNLPALLCKVFQVGAREASYFTTFGSKSSQYWWASKSRAKIVSSASRGTFIPLQQFASQRWDPPDSLLHNFLTPFVLTPTT